MSPDAAEDVLTSPKPVSLTPDLLNRSHVAASAFVTGLREMTIAMHAEANASTRMLGKLGFTFAGHRGMARCGEWTRRDA